MRPSLSHFVYGINFLQRETSMVKIMIAIAVALNTTKRVTAMVRQCQNSTTAQYLTRLS